MKFQPGLDSTLKIPWESFPRQLEAGPRLKPIATDLTFGPRFKIPEPLEKFGLEWFKNPGPIEIYIHRFQSASGPIQVSIGFNRA